MYARVFDSHRIQYSNMFGEFIENGQFYNSRVLDIGSGTGRYARLFAEQNCASLCCLDKSLDMIKQSIRKRIAAHHVLADAQFLPFRSDSFDMVVMTQVIQWIHNKKSAVSEVYRVLGTEGVFLLNTLSHRQLGNLVLMKHFPEIYQIELKRFPTITEATRLLNDVDFEIVTTKEIRQVRNYSICQLVQFAEDKATSALRLYADSIGKDDFKVSIQEYRKRLEAAYSNKSIHENHDYTLIVSVKR